MKFHELNSKFRMNFSDKSEVLSVVEFRGETARCTECRFRKVANRNMAGRPEYGCGLGYNDTMCGVPNNKWSKGNERPDGKQIIYK